MKILAAIAIFLLLIPGAAWVQSKQREAEVNGWNSRFIALALTLYLQADTCVKEIQSGLYSPANSGPECADFCNQARVTDKFVRDAPSYIADPPKTHFADAANCPEGK